MKLHELVLISTENYKKSPEKDGKYPTTISGSVTFSNKFGKLNITLSEKDISEIQQLLMYKVNQMMQEA